jgi:hypothetical protein
MGDDDPKKQWDDTPPWINQILAVFEKQMAKQVPHAPITFVIQRDELLAHISERATHFATEARMIESGEKPLGVSAHFEAMLDPSIPIGMRPDLEEKARAEAAEMRVKQLAFYKTQVIESLRTRSKTFRFMASHLAKTEAFTLDMGTAQWLDLVPPELHSAFVPPRVPIGVRAQLGEAGTLVSPAL